MLLFFAIKCISNSKEILMLLQAISLSKAFGGLLAVNSYSLAINPKEIVGLMGPNGAGKTTVLNLLSALDKPSKGTIRFLGHDVIGRLPHQVSSLGLARTFQNLRLFKEMSVLENVMAAALTQHSYSLFDALLMTPRFRKGQQALQEWARELLTRVGLPDDATMEAGKLPYGKQRRLEIARALATCPKLLLLDEPAAGMVQEEQQDLSRLLKSLRDEGLTLFVIDHNIAFLTGLCERIQVMRQGELIAEGSPQDVVKDKQVIEAYLGEEVIL
jgi:branched-chain amino acid transport system ATP-binding protein